MKNILFVLVLFALGSCGFNTVGTGRVGVKTQFGKIIESGIPEGLHFYLPLTGKSISEVDLRMQKEEGIEATFTKDNQEIKVTYVVTYSLDKNATEYIFRNGNNTYFATVGPQVIKGTMKEVIGQYDAETIVSKRPKVNSDVMEAIRTKLATKFITVDNFEVTNFAFDPQYQAAIEEKMIATQNAKKAENHTAEVREQKEQVILAAQGQAEAMKIKSQALSQNQNLVQYEAVLRWNGVLPVTMLGSSTPFINIK